MGEMFCCLILGSEDSVKVSRLGLHNAPMQDASAAGHNQQHKLCGKIGRKLGLRVVDMNMRRYSSKGTENYTPGFPYFKGRGMTPTFGLSMTAFPVVGRTCRIGALGC